LGMTTFQVSPELFPAFDWFGPVMITFSPGAAR